jgi:hypothetical protein
MGERHHLGGPECGLQAHARDILTHLEFVGSEGVILVGHSTMAADRSTSSGHPELAAMCEAARARSALPPPFDPFELPPGPLTERTLRQQRPMVSLTHSERCRFDSGKLTCPRNYVSFTKFPFFGPTAAQARETGWQVSEVTTGHMGSCLRLASGN